jgi:uncharacterized protein
MATPDPEPTEAELERLDLFLEESQPTEGMPLDAVDGLMAAVACGPGLVMPSVWLPVIWGGQMPEFESQTQAQEIMDLLMKMYNSVVRQINDGTYGPMISDYTNEEGETFEVPSDWCHGFIKGMNLRMKLWEKRLKSDEELNDILSPIVHLADPPDDLVDAWATGDTRDELLDALAVAVTDLRDYWREYGPQVGESDHTVFAPKGRKPRPGDRCPCGSGKRYRDCCGG